MITVVGIKSCDTCRKVLAWLASENLDHSYHDLRVDGLDSGQLARWFKACGWEALLNRRSATWRTLSDAEKSDLTAKKAEALMLAHPTLIKRPVFEVGGNVYIGFSDSVKATLDA
ncbi:MAG: arsenate reductase [Rhodospirillaceae bacterium]|nr:arsenate reductase [Rhodospirillaceae bacterium]